MRMLVQEGRGPDRGRKACAMHPFLPIGLQLVVCGGMLCESTLEPAFVLCSGTTQGSV